MKILHIVQCYHPVKGGAEWLAQNLSEQFANRHHDTVTVFTAAATKPAYFWRNEGAAMPAGVEQINGVTVRRFKLFRGLRFLRMVLARGFYRLRLPYHDWARTIQVGPIIPALPQAIVDYDADIIMATTFPFLHMQYAVMGARRAKKPLVLIGAIHTADKWGYDRKMFIRAIEKADAYIALTQFEKEYLVDKGIDSSKIKVIGGGVAATRFVEADGVQIRKKYGWGAAPVIAAITRQSELKRLDTLLEAMPLVWEQYPETRLLLAGARTNYSTVLDKIIGGYSSAQRANVTIVHDFPEADKPALLAAADIFVHPSGHESFGIVFVEAWAAGKAVIGANVGAVAALIAEGNDGLLFEYGDLHSLARAMVTLLADPKKRHAMGAAGQQKVLTHYSWEKVANQVRAVYEDVLNDYSVN